MPQPRPRAGAGARQDLGRPASKPYREAGRQPRSLTARPQDRAAHTAPAARTDWGHTVGSTRKTRAALAVAALLAGLLHTAAPAGAAEQRIYLLSDSAGPDGYWSPDASDPELAGGSTVRTCGEWRSVETEGDCWRSVDLASGRSSYEIVFVPGARVDDIRFVNGPLKFHFELAILPAADVEVRLILSEDGDSNRSAPATQIAPGVWEGTLIDAAPFHGFFNTLGVEITTAAPGIKATVQTGGRSWISSPEPLAVRGVPQLRAADPGASQPGSFKGASRTVWFNDGDWTAWSFTGDLRQTRTFAVDLAREARILLAWVETFDTPPIYDLLRGGALDPRELENSPGVSVLRAGDVVAAGTNAGARFRGQDSAAALGVAAGPIDVQVRPSSWDPDGGGQDLPYTVHLLAVHGERTLRGMHWRGGVSQDFRLPQAASCPYPFEHIPVTTEMTTYNVTLDADTEALPNPGWTLAYDIPGIGEFPCGGLTSGERMRFTFPSRDAIPRIGATPRQGATHVSQGDTVFEFGVEYTYDSPG